MSASSAHSGIRRHEWFLAGIAALVVFLVPMTVIGWLNDPEPEVRVLDTADTLSALVIDGDDRVLIINTDDREAAGAFLGRIAQPWEPRPMTIVAASDDDSAIGLWEALLRLEPATVVVAGVAGADPLWAAIDAECARRGIALRYVSGRVLISTDRLELTVFGTPPGTDRGRGVVVRHESISVLIALDGVPPAVDSHALVFNGEPPATMPDLLVTSDDAPRTPVLHEVLVDDRRAARLVLEEGAVRVFGGVLRSPALMAR